MQQVTYEKISLNDQAIMLRSFHGIISVPVVIESFEYLLTTSFINNHKYIALITDLTDSKINFKMNEFRAMVRFLKRNNTLSSIPFAVVVSSPMNRFFPNLATRALGMNIQIFSNLADAKNWCANLVKQTTIR